MDDVERERRNARRRERYAQDGKHRAKRRQQAEAWKFENRESYLAQQRQAAEERREQFPELRKQAQKKHYAKNSKKLLAATKVWRTKNPGYHSRWHAKNRLKNPILYAWRNCRNRAKQFGLEFNLEQTDIVVPEFCPVLGLKLEWSRNAKSGFFAPTSPSIDRIDNTKGYVKGNIQIISNRANLLKRDGTLAEFRKLVVFLESRESTDYQIWPDLRGRHQSSR